MARMKNLVRDVSVLAEKVNTCTRCGTCQAVCPLYARTRKEADVSRGKLSLLQGLMDAMFSDARGVNQRLQHCLLCGACQHNCPSGVKTQEIFILARSIITRYLGLPLSQKLVFKGLLARPEIFNRVSRMAAAFQPYLFRPQDNVQGTSCARVASPLLRHRHITPLTQTPFHGLPKQEIRGKGIRVSFFTGCLIDKAFPDIALDVLDVLDHYDARVFVPENQGCCGIPALAAGDMETFDTLVRTHVDLFSAQKSDYLVTACATCSSTIIKLWPTLMKERVAPDQLAKIEEIAQKTVDISWLLARRFRLPTATETADPAKQVTYHDPCHLKKSLDIHEEPRQVLRAAGLDLVEMDRADACCGMGGSFNLKHYDRSAQIGADKARAIADTKVSTVATSCPACMMQMADMTAAQGLDVKIIHPVQALAQALKKGS